MVVEPRSGKFGEAFLLPGALAGIALRASLYLGSAGFLASAAIGIEGWFFVVTAGVQPPKALEIGRERRLFL